jgi:hypothetical protein
LHYRNSNNDIVFFAYHFKNWMRANLPLINRTGNFIGDIYFTNGKVISDDETHVAERYVTNIESGFNSSRGTGGRGARKSECLPSGAG